MLRGESRKYSLRWKRKGHQKHLQNFSAAVAGGSGWGCWVQVPPTSVLPLCPCAGAVLARLVAEGGRASKQTDRQLSPVRRAQSGPCCCQLSSQCFENTLVGGRDRKEGHTVRS